MDSVNSYPVRFGFVGQEQPDTLKKHRKIAAEAWRIERTTPAKILETFAWLRIGVGEIAKYRDGISMHPLQQALQEHPKQAAEYQKIHNVLDAPSPRYTVQLWTRVGYGPKIEPAPRRGLEAHIIA